MPKLPMKHGEFHLFVDMATGSAQSGDEGGLGICLMQSNNGVFQPLAFGSRCLQKAERNYSPYVLEMAAACYGMEHFAHYLKGRRFYMYTDHKPLMALSANNQKTFTRLQDKMNEFDFDIWYTQGGPFNPANFLSHTAAQVHSTLDSETVALVQQKVDLLEVQQAFSAPTETTIRIAAITEVASLYPAWTWKEAQEQDPVLQEVR